MNTRLSYLWIYVGPDNQFLHFDVRKFQKQKRFTSENSY